MNLENASPSLDRPEPRSELKTLQPVILCGGVGTRLWPLSRERYPKQLLALTGGETLLQATSGRITPQMNDGGLRVLSPIVVANEDYRFLTAEQLRQAGAASGTILLEPSGRNTAPALTLAALLALEEGGDPILLAMPADHVIADVEAFRKAVALAAVWAASGRIVTFGIQPSRPESGYGYIRAGAPQADGSREIRAFVEKPEAAAAARFIASGDYLWNSGIFMLRASVWVDRLSSSRPDILASCRAALSSRARDLDFIRVDKASFEACPADSIDFAVMEKLAPGAGVVLPLDAGWSDVGAWTALWDINSKDADGNVVNGDALTIGTRNALVISQSRLVAVVGLDGVVVVETPDAVLVADKKDLRLLGEVVHRLKKSSRPEAETHRKIYRPWGYYDSVDSGHRFQVKRLVVNPGASLSLQLHHHRAEHWIVVKGTARVTAGDEIYLVSENESTYIPLGCRHRLENPGVVPLELIEVQSGSYLGEDDIVRLSDSYGRA